MSRKQVFLLVVVGILAVIAGITSFLLFLNPIGLTIVGVLTGLSIALMPSTPWFLPPVIAWFVLFTALTALAVKLLWKFLKTAATEFRNDESMTDIAKSE